MSTAHFWLHTWQQRGWLNHLLLPLSKLAQWVWLIRLRLTPSEVLPVPVIVVGNLWPGGAGKTPVVMALVELLQKEGIAVGVLSKGHGRKTKQTMLLSADSSAHQVGDEPLLIHRKTGVPVAVGVKRVDAAHQLLSAHPETQVLVCDDGLQHLNLAHDLALVILDERGLGNGWMLPAGPLREPWPRPPRARSREWVLSHGLDQPGQIIIHLTIGRLTNHSKQVAGSAPRKMPSSFGPRILRCGLFRSIAISRPPYGLR